MKRYLIISVLFLWVSGYSNVALGQSAGIKAGTDTAAINHLQHVADKTLNPDTAIVLYNRIPQLSADANYADGAFLALITKSIKYSEKEDFVQDRNCCLQAMQWAERSTIKDAIAWRYNGIGSAYFAQGDYAQASAYYYKALDDLKKKNVPPTHTTANVYNNLGSVNIRMGLPDKAIAYFRQGEEVSRLSHQDYQLANSLNNIGEYYVTTHHPDSAIKCFSELAEIGKKLGKLDLEVVANDDLGEAMMERGKYKEAIPLLQRSISLGKDHFPYLVVSATCALGQALCHIGEYQEAEKILNEGLKETKAHNFKDIYDAFYTALVAVYRATGEYKKALECTDSLMVIRDSLTNSENITAINQMEVKYKTAEKDKQIVQNQLLIVQQNNKIVRKNIWIVSVVGSIFLLAVIMASVYRNGQAKQRLQAAKIASLEQENTIGILKGGNAG